MAESVQLAVQPRSKFGTQATKHLRKQGLLPAVVYGHKQETLSLCWGRTNSSRRCGTGPAWSS